MSTAAPPPAAPPPPSDRTRVLRAPARGHYDAATVHAILDAAPICHVGYVTDDDQPIVIPTIHGRIDDALYLHGAAGNAMLRGIDDRPVSVTTTIIDGLVLARSVFHHSMNYRSVVVLGRGATVEDPDERMAALEAITERISPGRWEHCRLPNDKELRATRVTRIPLREASAKIRTGPPSDDVDDLDLDVWAGVVPWTTSAGAPEPAPDLRPGIAVPDHVAAMAPPHGQLTPKKGR
jgi:nitroimidazol reductase NimA-like FMN-containing flavoprotein (pyridoxamine 5'-phosphate oxidase superfamily)